jgi:putative membrane protein
MDINFYKDIFKDKEDLDPEVYKEFFAKQLILRDYLAIERTILTNEATFLAYVRTGLTIMVVGVTLVKLSEGYMAFQYIGVFMTLIGLYILVLGFTRTVQMRNKIRAFLRKKTETEQKL